MRNGQIQTVERAASTITNAITDSVRYAAQCSTEARRLTSKAQDALQDGLHETTRALKVMKRRAEKFEDAAEHYVKREPLNGGRSDASRICALSPIRSCSTTTMRSRTCREPLRSGRDWFATRSGISTG